MPDYRYKDRDAGQGRDVYRKRWDGEDVSPMGEVTERGGDRFRSNDYVW